MYLSYGDESKVKKMIFDNIDVRVEDLIDCISYYFKPDELYDIAILHEWALKNGYVEKDDCK